MRKGIVTILWTLGIAALVTAGCATTGGGKDRKSIDTTLAGWKAALEKQDIEGMMKAYSESFKSDRGNTKAEVKDFLTRAKEDGYLSGAKVDMTKTQINLDKGTATAGPIELNSSQGSMSISVTLKMDPDKVWRIVSSAQSN